MHLANLKELKNEFEFLEVLEELKTEFKDWMFATAGISVGLFYNIVT